MVTASRGLWSIGGVLQIMDMVPWVVGRVHCGMTQASSMVFCVLLSTLQFEVGEHDDRQ